MFALSVREGRYGPEVRKRDARRLLSRALCSQALWAVRREEISME